MSLLTAKQREMVANLGDEKGAVLPAGTYICRVASVEQWTNGTSLCWKFRIAYGQKHAGHEFWEWTGVNENSLWKTAQFYEALGFDAADPEMNEERDIFGLPCKVFVEIGTRSDTGEKKNKVAKIAKYEDADLPEEPEEKWDADVDAVFGKDDGLI